MKNRDNRVVEACEKYLKGSEIPQAVRDMEEPAYVFLYGAGHQFFDSYVQTGNVTDLAGARECLEAASIDFKLMGTPELNILYDIILLELGAVCSCQNENQRAIAVLSQCLKLSKQDKYEAGIAGSLNNLGMAYERQNDYRKAQDAYKESLAIQIASKTEDDAGNIAKTKWNLGRVELQLGNYCEAYELVSAANNSFKQLGFDIYYEQSSDDLKRIERAMRR